jgi:hypothetical protein
MTAQVIPLPYRHRAAFIERQAHRVAELTESAGERYIAHQIKTQRDAMLRKGIEPELIERELKCLDGAIRAALYRVLVTA